MTEPILIWGAGAIGGTPGAHWARAGVPVPMVDIVPEHVTACATSGLSIEGPVETFTQIVPCVTPEHLTGTHGRIVLAVKEQATESALAALASHLDPQVGTVAEIAAGHGIDTPLLRRLVELVHDIGDGRREMSAETFHEPTELLK